MTLKPNEDFLRSRVMADYLQDELTTMPDSPSMVVVVLSRQPNHFDAIYGILETKFGKEKFSFTRRQLLGSIIVAVGILGFDSSDRVSLPEFFAALSSVPFDEAGIYFQGKITFRVLPNEEPPENSDQA
jgi:hypothetical protein